MPPVLETRYTTWPFRPRDCHGGRTRDVFSNSLRFLRLIPAAHSQELLSPGDWLEKLDREHNKLVSPAGHVHARGRVLDVDIERPGSITILIDAVESADKTIRMPAMEMPFHVTNRRMLQGLRRGDVVDFEAARLKNAVMITGIQKAY